MEDFWCIVVTEGGLSHQQSDLLVLAQQCRRMQNISYARFSTLSGCISGFPSATGTSKIFSFERGIDVSYKTIRHWALKFGQASARWHLDEVFVTIAGKRMYPWRAVDCKGEVLDTHAETRRQRSNWCTDF